MKKRIIAALLTAAVCSAAVFAAGGKEAAASGPKEITIHLVQNSMVFDENWGIYKLAAAKNNVTLKGVASKNNTDYVQAYNLMIASGNLPDIISYKIPDLEKLGTEGGLMDLTDLINKHAPNIKKFMEQNPRLAQDMYSLDGKIYVIPTYYDYDNLRTAYGLFIRTDWLKKFNLQIPTTVPELEKVLTTIVNGDANGNGKKDEIGLFARAPAGAVDAVRYTGGIIGARPYDTYYVENGKVNYSPLEPTFRPAITTLSDWYKKGLIDKELFTRGATAREQVLPTNLGTATFDWFPSTGAFNTTIKDIPGFEFMPIPPIKDANGKVLSKSLARNTNNGNGWSISSKSKDPVTVIKFMDWWFTEEGRRAWNWGTEGDYYTMVNGKPQFTDLVLNNPDKLAPVIALNKCGAQVPGIGIWQDSQYEIATANDITKKGWEIYMTPGYVIEDIPTLKISPAEQAELARIDAAVNQTSAEYVQKWILGAANINTDWDTYIKRIKEQGVDRAIQIRQAAYDRFSAKKN